MVVSWYPAVRRNILATTKRGKRLVCFYCKVIHLFYNSSLIFLQAISLLLFRRSQKTTPNQGGLPYGQKSYKSLQI